MVRLYLTLLMLVAAERVVEMALSAANRQWALSRGGIEFGQRHFLSMKLAHSAFLVGCAAEVVMLQRPFLPALGYSMLVVVGLAQALRYWAIAALGRRWNIRVIVVPGLPAVDRGPYRFVRHPNYVAVILEGFALPLIHSAWLTAIVFSSLNALILWVRVRCEEQALMRHSSYACLQERPRWTPWGRSRVAAVARGR